MVALILWLRFGWRAGAAELLAEIAIGLLLLGGGGGKARAADGPDPPDQALEAACTGARDAVAHLLFIGSIRPTCAAWADQPGWR
jgi:hypothetical protein